MKSQKTIYHLIVDKSGSMHDCIENTIMGFNDQVTRIIQMEKRFPEQDITIGLTTFNHQACHHFFHAQPNTVEPLTEKTYHPNGNTALLDAIGLTAKTIESDMAIFNLKIPTTAVVVILTDGHENASGMYNFNDIRNMISRLEATGKWTFSFIGATLDAADVAEQMNIKRVNSYSFNKNEMKEAVWEKLSSSMEGYFVKKRSGKDTGNLFDK